MPAGLVIAHVILCHSIHKEPHDETFTTPGVAVVGLLLLCAFALLLSRKLQQRQTIAELLKQEHISVQFMDGGYCESLAEVQKRSWLFDTVDVVYVDVQDGGSPHEILPLIERLPSLSSVIIRYQGNDFEEFTGHHNTIQEKLARESTVVAQAFPKLKVLKCASCASWDHD